VSDFSGLEQSFALSAVTPLLDDSFLPGRVPAPRARMRSYEVQLDEVEFRCVQASDELAAIQRMRTEIQLPGTAVADPRFQTREKKETGRGLSALSNGVTTSSGR